MAHKKGYFTELFNSKNIKKNGKNYKINIDFGDLGRRLDQAQMALDAQVWYDMQKYMPKREGSGHLRMQTNKLNAQAIGTGEVHVYDPLVEYAHYQYEGEKYVDPVYRKGAFFSPDYGFWSRKGVKKVPSGEPLHYTNPNATSHWDETAIANHESQWVEVVERALNG